HRRRARARRVDASALAGERWITFPLRPGSAREPYASALERGLAIVGVSAPEVIHIDSLTAQKRMVEAGFGLALLAESSVDEELRRGTLRALPVPGLRATIPVVLIHRRRAYLGGAARALMATLTAWPGVSAPRRPSSARRRARSSGGRAAPAAAGRSSSRRW